MSVKIFILVSRDARLLGLAKPVQSAVGSSCPTGPTAAAFRTNRANRCKRAGFFQKADKPMTPARRAFGRSKRCVVSALLTFSYMLTGARLNDAAADILDAWELGNIQ